MASNTEKIWTVSDVTKLISLYEENPCLYNTLIKDYKDKPLRKLVMQRMAEELQTTENEVTKKINSLRSQFNRERAKVVAELKSGSGVEEAKKYIITWVHFESLQFLKDFVTAKRSRSNFLPPTNMSGEIEFHEEPGETENEEIDNDVDSVVDMVELENVESTPINIKPSTKKPLPFARKPRKFQKIDEEEEERKLLKSAVTVMQNAVSTQSRQPPTQDADDIFGLYVASELKNVKSVYVKKMLKHKIQNIIFETQMSGLGSSHINQRQVSQPISSYSRGYSADFCTGTQSPSYWPVNEDVRSEENRNSESNVDYTHTLASL